MQAFLHATASTKRACAFSARLIDAVLVSGAHRTKAALPSLGWKTGRSIVLVLFSRGVAADAVAPVRNLFFPVFVVDLPSVMAVVTGIPSIVVARMASHAVTVGFFVVYWKGMAKACAGPGTRRVAVAALSPIVVGRRPAAVTARTVGETRVVELYLFSPVRGAAVAVAALPPIVAHRRGVTMAARTVGETGVIELHLPPIRGAAVTVAALPSIVVGRCSAAVAARTVGETVVVELHLFRPVRGAAVTVAALPSIVVGRCSAAVAACTVGETAVVEQHLFRPIRGAAVTVAALPSIVVHRRGVAVTGLAVGETGVIEQHLFHPVCGAAVTVAALSSIVIHRCGVAVTGLTVGETGVIEQDFLPGVCAQVTAVALALIVICRRVLDVTSLTVHCVDVIERNLVKTARVMALLASKPAHVVVWICVAVQARLRGALVHSLCVAALAVCLGVRTVQGKGVVLQRTGRKRHRA